MGAAGCRCVLGSCFRGRAAASKSSAEVSYRPWGHGHGPWEGSQSLRSGPTDDTPAECSRCRTPKLVIIIIAEFQGLLGLMQSHTCQALLHLYAQAFCSVKYKKEASRRRQSSSVMTRGHVRSLQEYGAVGSGQLAWRGLAGSSALGEVHAVYSGLAAGGTNLDGGRLGSGQLLGYEAQVFR